MFNFFFHLVIFFYNIFFFLVIDLNLLIPAVIAHIINPITELVTRTGIPTKEEKADMETHSVIIEPKIRKCSI